MKPTKQLLIAALIAMFSFSCSNDLQTEEELQTIDLPQTPVAKDIEIEILELINQHRLEIGLPVLTNHNTVKAVAFTHTDYMIEVDNVSHDNFFLRKNSLVENASASIVSENVAYAYNSAESVVNAWLASEGHRENIEGDFVYTDVSAELNEDGKWYFTNIFMK
ncbi:MAG: CAP domain-containing protein [Bacteroidota bacterium]